MEVGNVVSSSVVSRMGWWLGCVCEVLGVLVVLFSNCWLSFVCVCVWLVVLIVLLCRLVFSLCSWFWY